MKIMSISKMKIIKLIFSILLVVMIALSNISCTYNESPIYSSTNSDTYYKTIQWHEWEMVVPSKAGHWYKRLYISNITQSVINSGIVLVYYKNYETNNWILLPYSTTLYNGLNQQFAEEIWFGYALGTLDIDYVYTNPLDMTPTTIEFKIVVVRL